MFSKAPGLHLRKWNPSFYESPPIIATALETRGCEEFSLLHKPPDFLPPGTLFLLFLLYSACGLLRLRPTLALFWKGIDPPPSLRDL